MFTISKSQKKACGIAVVGAGILGILAAQLNTLVFGFSGAIESEGVIAIGMGAVLFSFLTCVFGAASMSVESKIPGILLIITAIIGAVLGGTLVAVFMAFAILVGIFALLGEKKSELTPV